MDFDSAGSLDERARLERRADSYDGAAVSGIAQETLSRKPALTFGSLSTGAGRIVRSAPRAWMLIFGLAMIDFFWGRRAGMALQGWASPALAVAFLAGIGVFYGHSSRNPHLADAGTYAALWISFSAIGAILTYLVATLGFPLRDVEFVRFDAVMGFNWRAMDTFIAGHRPLELLCDAAYDSFLPQIVGSILFLAHVQRSDRNAELLWGAMLSLLVTAFISGLLPAVGPYVHFHRVQQDYSVALLGLRDGTLSKITLGDMKGIIAFPSFHTVLGILLVYVHRPPLRSFVPIAVLNALMLLAVPFAGHHYLVDMIGGAAVVVPSIILARFLIRRSAV